MNGLAHTFNTEHELDDSNLYEHYRIDAWTSCFSRILLFYKVVDEREVYVKVLAAGCIVLGILGILCFWNRIHACLLASAILIDGGLLMVSMPGIVAVLLVKATRSKSMNSQETFNNHLE